MSFQVGVGAFHWSLRGKGFRTRGGTFRSSSDPGEGTRAPGASWASLAATTRIGPGFAMSSATRAASFPEMRCCFILVSYSGRRNQREKSSTAQHFDVLPGRAWVPSIDHYEAKAFGHAEAPFGPARTQARARERLVPLGLRWQVSVPPLAFRGSRRRIHPTIALPASSSY